ncbi:MAG: AI-2E family transporter [Patescibacteria group bacterium]
MNHQKTELYFLFFLLAVVFVLSFFIFQPFLYALVFAVVFTTVFAGVHKKILFLTRQNKGLAALLSTVLVLAIVITPLVFLTVQMFRETTSIYSSIATNGGLNDFSGFITSKLHSLERFIHVPIHVPAGVSLNMNQYLKNGLDWLIQNLGFIFSHAIFIMGSFIVFLIALYYLFKDGKDLKESLIKLSPLKDVYSEKIFTKLSMATNSVVIGSLLIAVIQGIFATAGFAIFGVPNAVVWGSIASLAALIPGVGTSLVVIPAVIFLFFKGNMFHTFGLLIWGVTIVTLIDNGLKPKLIERGMTIHPFLILLSALGGIVFFGPIGFLLGPLVLGLLFVLLEIYSSIQKES